MSKVEKKNEPMEVKVEFEKSAKRGEYANFVRIQHTAMDFRFDFARAIPDENSLKVHTRMFMSPIHTKMFLKALEDNIQKYESQFGPIEFNAAETIPLTTSGSKTTH